MIKPPARIGKQMTGVKFPCVPNPLLFLFAPNLGGTNRSVNR
jgi:hypothetical protein